MSYVDYYNLEEGKRYRFCTRFDLMKNIDDLMPHYYRATYVKRKATKGHEHSIWIFENFIDQETNESVSKKEIKHFGVNYGLVFIEEDKEDEDE